MPVEIEEVFASCGTPLFPRSAADLDIHCSCPDWGVPCKHLAAVCYVLAEAFDDDPFEMLAWRGRTRGALLAALRQAGPRPAASAGSARGIADAPAASADADSAYPASATHAVLADVTGPPLARALDGFWTPGLSQARLRALAAPSATPATRICYCECSTRPRSQCAAGTFATSWPPPTSNSPRTTESSN